MVSSCGKDQISLHKVTKHLLQGSSETILLSRKSPNELKQVLVIFFIDKIQGIIKYIISQVVSGNIQFQIHRYSVYIFHGLVLQEYWVLTES